MIFSFFYFDKGLFPRSRGVCGHTDLRTFGVRQGALCKSSLSEPRVLRSTPSQLLGVVLCTQELPDGCLDSPPVLGVSQVVLLICCPDLLPPSSASPHPSVSIKPFCKPFF